MNQKSIHKNQYTFLTYPSQSYRIKTDETFRLVVFVTEGFSERKELSISVEGDNASCDVVLFFLGNKKNTYPCDITLDVLGEKSHITVSVRSLLTDSASLDMNGRCTLNKEAKDADIFFQSHTLLLSPDARARVIPSLEVLVDEVRAGHAATVGRVDKEQIFFLQSRGFSKQESIALIARHFFSDALAILPEKVGKQYEKKLTTFLTQSNFSYVSYSKN